MTLFISAIGVIGRLVGAALTSTLGWASSLLFGRVPRSHQIFVILMLSGSLLWMALIVIALVSRAPDVVLGVTPHPGFIDGSWLHLAALIGIALVPLFVGVAAYLVPDDEDRRTGLGIVVELLRGYLLTPILSVLLLFLPAVGISRKARSVRHRWSDIHLPVVVKPKRYDQLVSDLLDVLGTAGLPVEAKDAPKVLSMPALLLTAVAGKNVRKLRPDRLVELCGPDLRLGIYPSDLAISGPAHECSRARAAILSGLPTTAAYLTTSKEGQAVEDRLDRLTARVRSEIEAPSSELAAELAMIDATLLDLEIPTEEWDILYRLRLRAERDAINGIDLARVEAPAPEASTASPKLADSTASRQAAASEPGSAAIGEARTADG